MKRKSLSSADPEGRLDVAVFRVFTRAAEKAEKRFDLPGLSEALEPSVEELVSTTISSKPLWAKANSKLVRSIYAKVQALGRSRECIP